MNAIYTQNLDGKNLLTIRVLHVCPFFAKLQRLLDRKPFGNIENRRPFYQTQDIGNAPSCHSLFYKIDINVFAEVYKLLKLENYEENVNVD